MTRPGSPPTRSSGRSTDTRLLWVLALSTVALILFHELGARMGVVTGKGLSALIRERFGRRGATVALGALVIANVGTTCAEFAGIAAGSELLFGVGRYVSVPLAAGIVGLLILRGSFRRVEHLLLGLSALLATYVVSGLLAKPDWAAAAKGTLVPGIPLTRDAILVAVATLGTTLAPWGLAFIQYTPSTSASPSSSCDTSASTWWSAPS